MYGRNSVWTPCDTRRKLEKRKPYSTFSEQFLFSFKPAWLINFQIYRRGGCQGAGYVAAFWAMWPLVIAGMNLVSYCSDVVSKFMSKSTGE